MCLGQSPRKRLLARSSCHELRVPSSPQISINQLKNKAPTVKAQTSSSRLEAPRHASDSANMRPVTHYLAFVISALSVSESSATSCTSDLSGSYLNAIAAYPNLKQQIELVSKQQVAQWYTDRVSDVAALAKSVVLPKCSDESQDSSPPTIVVYGLPQKDCAHGYSTSGSNADTEDYRVFLRQLADAAGDQQVVYILEPDAIGLLADQGCGNDKGYAANLGVALDILSQNANAEIYLDIGYWTLSNDEQAAAVAKIVTAVDPQGKSKGIALNTSNYRSNTEMAATCERFVKASGKDYKCILDTSRNFVSPPSNEWCNADWAGIGELPTTNTGSSYVSRYVWVKPPGESDGECSSQTDQALRGPSAGNFFPDHFVQLWDNGVFVQKLGKAAINAAANTTSNSTASQTDATTQTAQQDATQTIEITSLAALEVADDEALGQVHPTVDAGDSWSSDDEEYATTAPTMPTTPTPTTSSPVVVEVEPPHTMVVVDVVSNQYSVDDSDGADFTSADDDSIVETVERIRKHKACE
jgi:hypothetical protein